MWAMLCSLTNPVTNPVTNPLTNPVTNPVTNPLTNPVTNPPLSPLVNVCSSQLTPRSFVLKVKTPQIRVCQSCRQGENDTLNLVVARLKSF